MQLYQRISCHSGFMLILLSHLDCWTKCTTKEGDTTTRMTDTTVLSSASSELTGFIVVIVIVFIVVITGLVILGYYCCFGSSELSEKISKSDHLISKTSKRGGQYLDKSQEEEGKSKVPEEDQEESEEVVQGQQEEPEKTSRGSNNPKIDGLSINTLNKNSSGKSKQKKMKKLKKMKKQKKQKSASKGNSSSNQAVRNKPVSPKRKQQSLKVKVKPVGKKSRDKQRKDGLEERKGLKKNATASAQSQSIQMIAKMKAKVQSRKRLRNGRLKEEVQMDNEVAFPEEEAKRTDYGEGVCYYRKILKSLHSVKSVSQYFPK